MAFKTLAEIWSYYDVKERKRFAAHDVTAAIRELPEENPEKEKCYYESLAFCFVGTNRENEWGTYYGHQFTFVRQDTGEEVYSPDITQVTPEIIEYWEHRAAEVVNPLLKMRYTGLVLDFKKRITGNQPDYKTIKLANVEAILDVVEGDYAQHDMIALDYTDRALKLAVNFNNKDLIGRVVNTYYDAHKRFGEKKYWGHIFHALINYRKHFAQYEEEIVSENLERLNAIEQKALEEGNKTDSFAHEMASQVDILCEYYHSIGEDEKIDGLLDRLLVAIKLPISVRGAMWGQVMLDRMQKRYRQYGYDKKANRLFVDISALGERTLKEMNKTEHTFTLKRKEVNEFLNYINQGTHEERLIRYIIDYICCKEQEVKKQKEMAKQFPLEELVSTVTFDNAGNTTNRIGAGKNPDEQKLHFFINKNLRIESFFMHVHMEELKKNKDVTVESLMALFNGSPLVVESHKEFLRRGFEAYLNDDHIVCCHLLIPQFEAMIRMLIALNGGEVLRQGADPAAGNEYLSLDSLLDSEVAKEYLKEDMITYFKVLFVSQPGWNLRNLFCHGLLTADSFNSTMSDRVVHAIMVLRFFKYK